MKYAVATLLLTAALFLVGCGEEKGSTSTGGGSITTTTNNCQVDVSGSNNVINNCDFSEDNSVESETEINEAAE
jgi:ABC-type phosphate transport system substrate-binding protein